METTTKSSPQKPASKKRPAKPAATLRDYSEPDKPSRITPDSLDLTGEELIIENFAAVSRLVETMGEALELLTQKVENMAYHIIATEEILAELVADNGINLPRVNTRIRQRISAGTDCCGDPSRAIDVAASIASPLPRR